MIDQTFWESKKVFITGNTGFKGSWLTLWLQHMGAEVMGYSLQPPTNPSLFKLLNLDQTSNTVIADIRDRETLSLNMQKFNPDIVFHMAAQPLVRESYKNPVETYEINVIGTVNLFEAVRACKNVRAVINVTTDKCYENKEWFWGYRENEPMGGYDPYSNSKACSELVTNAYRSSFFNPDQYEVHRVGIASARAGNVIGGGDWATDRLIPDCIKALLNKEEIIIRNPNSIRPWQHVLEPLSGYLVLAEQLYLNGPTFSEGWNFGPNDSDAKSVEWIVRKICEIWGGSASFKIDSIDHPHEAQYLKLDCSKAKGLLGWSPRWTLNNTLDKIIDWVKVYHENGDVIRECLNQIDDYINSTPELQK